jgi:putative FmdB family regulatory protein
VVVDARLPHLERLTYPRAPAAPLCDHAKAVPTYDYQCRQCGHTTEVIHSMKEEGPTTCQNCGGGPLRRVMFPAGIIFKGSGFYKTDSRSSGSKSTTAAPAAKDAGGAADSKSASTGSEPASTAPASGKSESPKSESTKSD